MRPPGAGAVRIQVEQTNPSVQQTQSPRPRDLSIEERTELVVRVAQRYFEYYGLGKQSETAEPDRTSKALVLVEIELPQLEAKEKKNIAILYGRLSSHLQTSTTIHELGYLFNACVSDPDILMSQRDLYRELYYMTQEEIDQFFASRA